MIPHNLRTPSHPLGRTVFDMHWIYRRVAISSLSIQFHISCALYYPSRIQHQCNTPKTLFCSFGPDRKPLATISGIIVAAGEVEGNSAKQSICFNLS